MLQESTEAPGGRHVAVLGSYDPHSKQATIDGDKIKYWLVKGAKTSDSVHNLLVAKGIISEKKRSVKIPKKEIVEESKPEEAKKKETKVEEVKKEEIKTAEAKTEAAEVAETKTEESPKEKKAAEETAPKSE